MRLLLSTCAALLLAAPAFGAPAGGEGTASDLPPAPTNAVTAISEMQRAQLSARDDYNNCMRDGHIPLREARTITRRLNDLQERLARADVHRGWTQTEADGAEADLARIRAGISALCPQFYTQPEAPRRPRSPRPRRARK